MFGLARHRAMPWLARAAFGALLFVSQFPAKAQVADPVQAFLPAWNRLAGTAGWQMLVSAPFPQTWPPSAPGSLGLVRYAFAMRLRPGLADGVETASPWAQATENADGSVSVKVLQSMLHPLGIQGVRPLRSGEWELAGREAEVAALLRAGGDRATDELVRAYTCNWIARQGVIAAAITPLHPAFTQWLACQSRPTLPSP